MFKYIKELIEAIKEGLTEGEAEYEAEKRAQSQVDSEAIQKVKQQDEPTIENVSIALSCPFRSLLTSGSVMRLLEFGWLTDNERKSFKKILKRDFGLKDSDDVFQVMDALDESYGDDESLERSVFLAGLNLYVLTSAVEVEYLSFSDVESLCSKQIGMICKDAHVESWAHYASLFMEGECINNAIGRKFLKKNINSLLTEDSSPWQIFPWDKIIRTCTNIE